MSKQGLGAVLGVAVAGWDVWAGCGGSACVHGQATWAGGEGASPAPGVPGWVHPGAGAAAC